MNRLKKTARRTMGFRARPGRLWTAAAMILLALLGINVSGAGAQDRAVTLAVPGSMASVFRDVILPRFQAANPGVFVQLTTVDDSLVRNLPLPTTSAELQNHLDATAQLVGQADVQLVLPFMIGPESTRAGYYLDLRPLVAVDPNLPAGDFVPALRDAYSWDGGQWAVPVMATPLVVIYDPAAFDAAGLAYPNGAWTFDDFANAARLLASPDAPGLGVTSFDLPAFFRILSGQGFTDTGVPAGPTFDAPGLADMVGQWAALEADGIVTSGYAPDAPLRLGRINELLGDLRGALLDGGSDADVYGVAISSGTTDPESAYRLAVYLTTVTELATFAPGSLPARYSVQPEQGPYSLSAAALALGRQALEQAITPADMQFGQYLRRALAPVAAGQPVDSALADAQQAAAANLARVEEIRSTVLIVVPTVVPPAPVAGVTIKFALFTGSTDFSDRAQWEAAVDAFVAADPGVNAVDIDFVGPYAGYWDEIPKNDCAFGYSYTQYADDVLPLDPLLNADPTFDPADVVGDALRDAQQDGQTYAVPTVLYPYVMRYNRDSFARAGLPEPDGTWTVNAFVDALGQLQTVTDGPPLYPDLNYSTPWELLMAAYGAAPVDYTTDPPTLHLTDPDVVASVRQVLDLARSGLINYRPMATLFGAGGGPGYTPALVTSSLRFAGAVKDDSGLVTFPIGTQTTPVSFDTTSGFIFTHAPDPDGCYRWLREITRHPELFGGMPAYHSVIDSPATQAVYGASGVAAFRRFARLMEAPDRVFVRLSGLGPGDSLFMTRAFDRYVLEGADLESELAGAQELTAAYRACMAAGGADPVDCLLATDPTTRENIPGYILGNR